MNKFLSFLLCSITSFVFAQNPDPNVYIRYGDARSNTMIVTNAEAFARADITNSVINKTDIVVETNSLDNVSYNIRGTEYSIQPANSLQGKTFDFSTMAGLYIAVSNIVFTMGGTIQNFPSLQ